MRLASFFGEKKLASLYVCFLQTLLHHATGLVLLRAPMSMPFRATRDASFTQVDNEGSVVNRTEAIACLGGSALDNEECYLLVKMARALGLVYIEHHARI